MDNQREMPEILTLRCAACGCLAVLRGVQARRARDDYRSAAGGGHDVEFGDTITINCGHCSPQCIAAAEAKGLTP